jgi:hypothetical protein
MGIIQTPTRLHHFQTLRQCILGVLFGVIFMELIEIGQQSFGTRVIVGIDEKVGQIVTVGNLHSDNGLFGDFLGGFRFGHLFSTQIQWRLDNKNKV